MTKFNSPLIGGHKWQTKALQWVENTNGTGIGSIPGNSLGGNKDAQNTLSGN